MDRMRSVRQVHAKKLTSPRSVYPHVDAANEIPGRTGGTTSPGSLIAAGLFLRWRIVSYYGKEKI